jgi:putative glycosyltransferase (TIGR04372 family)
MKNISIKRLNPKNIQKKMRKYSQFIVLAVANVCFGGKMQIVTRDQFTTAKYSGVLGKSDLLDFQKIYKDWEHSENLWSKGLYLKSCDLKRNCLEKIYQSQRIDGTEQIPPILSYGWSAAIGHIGILGAFVTGQELGIVPKLKRYLPVKSVSELEKIEMIFQEKVMLLKSAHSFAILEHPSQWHLSERLSMIRKGESFISLYEMYEQVYNSLNSINSRTSIKLNERYRERGYSRLLALGLPKDAWFVGLHIREKPNMLDPRNASVENYHAAVNYIVPKGGWVIRFGTDKMRPLPITKNVLDLNLDTPENRFLHLYILAKSRFFLTTNSGPAMLANALNTPVLQTNTLSIGRNILTASAGSLYLPKVWKFEGRKLSYSEIVTSPEGYSETDLRQKSKCGYSLFENSENDILSATMDMFETSEAGSVESSEMRKLNSRRKEVEAVGFGQIAPTFLRKNESWFLA